MGEPCPSLEVLRQLVLGELEAGERTRVESHLVECDLCETRFNEMSRCAMSLRGPLEEENPDPTTHMGRGETEAQRAMRRRSDLFGEVTLDAAASGSAVSKVMPRIPGYQVLRWVAQGGMGVVLEARQDVLDRVVAIKLPLFGAVGTTQERDRFVREARSAARLRHPNICPILEVGEVGNRPFISMAFIDGPTLRDWVKAQQPNARQIAVIVAAVTKAVAYAHGHGVIHRDIKPSNILIDSESQQPMLTDFGLAKELGEDSVEVTQTGQVMGTPAYMSPEQAAGRTEQLGPGTDIYALGALLYDLLTGTAPFSGSTGEVLRKVQTDSPIAPRKLQPKLHKDLETIVLKAMSKAVKDRYETAQALGEDLERFAAGEAIMARREPVLRRAGRFLERNRVPLGVAALLLLAGAIVIGQISARARVSSLRDQVRTALESADLWDPPQLAQLDSALAQLLKRAPQAADDLRRQAGVRLAAQLHEELNSPDLGDAALERVASRIEQLPGRGVDDITSLRKLLAERRQRWEMVTELKEPFDNLWEVFSWQFYPMPDGLASKGDGSEGIWESCSEMKSPQNAMVRARFVPAREAAGDIGVVVGVTLSHERNWAHYKVTVGIPPSLWVGAKPRQRGSAESASKPATRASTPAKWEQPAGRVRLTLWRNNRRMLQRDFDASRFTPGAPIEVQLTRESDVLTGQLNKLPVLSTFDLYPEPSKGHFYGVVSSEGVRLVHLALFKGAGAAPPSELEQADGLFIAKRYLDAREAYRAITLSDRVDAVRQAARFKEALCLLEMKRPNEAATLLETLSTTRGDRWPSMALLRLWALRLEERRFAEADALYEALRLRTTPEQLRMLLPTLSYDSLALAMRTCGMVVEGANLATLDRETLDRFEKVMVISEVLFDSGSVQGQRYFQIKARHQIGDLRRAASLAEQFLADPNNDDAETVIHVLEEYGWVQSQRGQTKAALDQVRRRLEKQGGGWNQPFLPLLVERARLYAVQGDWQSARKDIDAYIDLHTTTRYRWLGLAYLMKGFIAEQEGDRVGAIAAWRKGARKPSTRRGGEGFAQELGAAPDHPDEYLTPAELQYACILTALSGEMSDAWAGWYLQRFANMQEIDEHPGSQNPLSNLKSSVAVLDAAIARECWLSPRGQKMAREIAFHLTSRPERMAAMPALLGFELMRRSSPTQPLSAELDGVYWQTANEFYDHFFRYKRGGTIQGIATAVAWKGGLGTMGWQGLAPTLPPDMRARAAFVLARKMQGQARREDAVNLLKEAQSLTEKDTLLGRLIEAELKSQ